MVALAAETGGAAAEAGQARQPGADRLQLRAAEPGSERRLQLWVRVDEQRIRL